MKNTLENYFSNNKNKLITYLRQIKKSNKQQSDSKKEQSIYELKAQLAIYKKTLSIVATGQILAKQDCDGVICNIIKQLTREEIMEIAKSTLENK